MSIALDVRDLLRAPGTMRTVDVAEPVAGLSMELARVPEDRAVRASIILESLVEGILASGPVQGAVSATCARCLTTFELPMRVDVREMFAPLASTDDDVYPLVDGTIDLEPMIRDAVILAMPFAPLCRVDCLGLCPRCGGDRNNDECTCPPEIDARWAPLMYLEAGEARKEF